MPPTQSKVWEGWGLPEWLRWQESLHPRNIELGLDRVRAIAQRLGLPDAGIKTLTVGGTNGKGSSATLASLIYREAGYKTGLYTSPHLLRYNERVAIDGAPVSDEDFCRAFRAIEAARGEVSLTYFEFGTLAALWLFREARVQMQVLEVGLGGRLDAVNIVDADCALVTNIGLDHTDWLGKDRESIAREKAGILRTGRPAIYVEADVPDAIEAAAKNLGAKLLVLGCDYYCTADGEGWHWHWRDGALLDLPRPGLGGGNQLTNAAGVLAAVQALQGPLPVPETAIRSALPRLTLAGRFQRCGNTILDVAHNAEAAQVLADNLRAANTGRVWLVLGMLSDKPLAAVCAALAPRVRQAFCGTLPGPRGLDGETLASQARKAGMQAEACADVGSAYARARQQAGPGETIVVCGSFLTVAAIAKQLEDHGDG